MNKNDIKISFDKNNHSPYSLHDSRIKEIKFHNKTLTFKIDQIFEYLDGEEKTYPGKLYFHDCDLELCRVLVFNKILGQGYFTGKAYDLKAFMAQYKDADFEIITEGYFGNTTTYSGWLWGKDKNPVSAIMYLWNSGAMEYLIDEKINSEK